MIVTEDILRKRFAYCNKEYFEGKLARPRMSIGKFTKDVARIWWEKNKKTKRAQNIEIKFSTLFDFTDEMLTDVMCHEMIHLFLIRKKIYEKDHGPLWQNMAKELNEKYGLHITKTFEPKQVGELDFGSKVKEFFLSFII